MKSQEPNMTDNVHISNSAFQCRIAARFMVVTMLVLVTQRQGNVTVIHSNLLVLMSQWTIMIVQVSELLEVSRTMG